MSDPWPPEPLKCPWCQAEAPGVVAASKVVTGVHQDAGAGGICEGTGMPFLTSSNEPFIPAAATDACGDTRPAWKLGGPLS